MYEIRMIYYGTYQNSIFLPTKKQAKKCFYTHYNRGDCCPMVVHNGQTLSIKQAMRHFGKQQIETLQVLKGEKAG
ncbi:MAG: hypothetical protein RSD74_02035 [Angelakisella sp.]